MFDQNENYFANQPYDDDGSMMPGQNPEAPPLKAAPAIPAPDSLGSLYPEIYYDLYQPIADAVSKMIAAGYSPTGDMLDKIVDNIIKNSGMWYEDEDDDFDRPDAIPVVLGGYGSSPYRRRRRRHHNRNSLRDIIRILLLQGVGRGNIGHGKHYPQYY